MSQPKQGDLIIEPLVKQSDIIFIIEKVDFKNKKIHAVDIANGDKVFFRYHDIVTESIKYFPKTVYVLA
jgi:hypothetical protein